MKWRGVVFGLICALWLLFFPVAAFLAFMAPRLASSGLDAPAWALMVNFYTLPAAVVLLPVAAVILRGKGRPRLGWALLAAPLLWLAVPAVVWSAVQAL